MLLPLSFKFRKNFPFAVSVDNFDALRAATQVSEAVNDLNIDTPLSRGLLGECVVMQYRGHLIHGQNVGE